MKKLKILGYGLLFLLISSLAYAKYYNMNINDIGLKVLSWVKKIKGDAIDLKTIQKDFTPIMDHQPWTDLLQKFVTKTGQVNYQGFQDNKDSLQQYLNQISAHPPGNNWSEKEKLAYWINAYNAFTVKLIIDHYPVKTIKEIGGGITMVDSPWDLKFFKVGDVEFDLNTIEHEILRKEFNEPRIHFAVNCASFSCPIIRNEAFVKERIDAQLDEQFRGFLNNPDKNIISAEKLQLSKIFNWFESDFTKSQSLISILQQYTDVKINDDAQIEYMDYSWVLNE